MPRSSKNEQRTGSGLGEPAPHSERLAHWLLAATSDIPAGRAIDAPQDGGVPIAADARKSPAANDDPRVAGPTTPANLFRAMQTEEAASQIHAIEADNLGALIAQAKLEGSIDPALSTQALVLFFHALSLGTRATLSTQSDSRSLPSEEAWAALFMKLLESLSPPLPNSLSNGSG